MSTCNSSETDTLFPVPDLLFDFFRDTALTLQMCCCLKSNRYRCDSDTQGEAYKGRESRLLSINISFSSGSDQWTHSRNLMSLEEGLVNGAYHTAICWSTPDNLLLK